VITEKYSDAGCRRISDTLLPLLLTILKILRFAAALLRIWLGGIGVRQSRKREALLIKHHFPMGACC
jgi:hypothetical protein